MYGGPGYTKPAHQYGESFGDAAEVLDGDALKSCPCGRGDKEHCDQHREARAEAYCRKDMGLKHPVGQCPYDEPVSTPGSDACPESSLVAWGEHLVREAAEEKNWAGKGFEKPYEDPDAEG